jgi:hypothetical protein
MLTTLIIVFWLLCELGVVLHAACKTEDYKMW